MAQPFPPAVVARLQASGGSAPVSLFEVQTLSGNTYFWSEAAIAAPSLLAPAVPLTNFVPWLLDGTSFHGYKSTQTRTGRVQVQNLSGDSVRRDASLIFSRQEMVNALVAYRRWLTDCEYATYTFVGSVDDAQIEPDGSSMTLTLEGFTNWSKLAAPSAQTGVSCPLTFGSVECGSTAGTPCNNDYGTCSSIERFQGILVEWTGASLNPTQYVQPQPLRLFNGRVAG